MKKPAILLMFLLSCQLSEAQFPQNLNFQVIARDGPGKLVANQAFPLKTDIRTSLTEGYTSDTFNPSADKLSVKSEDEKWPFISLSLNVAGFLVTGPIAQLDFRIAKRTFLGAYFAYHYMGLFAGKVIFDYDITSFSPKSMGGGINLKQYFKAREPENSWYCGIYLGYSYNEAAYHSGLPNEGVEKLNDLVLFGSGGYRWNIGKHFYILDGLHFGISYTYYDKYFSTYTLDPKTGTYIKQETFQSDYSGGVYPNIMEEFTLGINF